MRKFYLPLHLYFCTNGMKYVFGTNCSLLLDILYTESLQFLRGLEVYIVLNEICSTAKNYMGLFF